jgi:tetratricopeptide (TPR) repeat protein
MPESNGNKKPGKMATRAKHQSVRSTIDMGNVLQFPAGTARLGYKRSRKCRRPADNPDQLQLFAVPTAQIVDLKSELTPFEQALHSDERGDPRAAEFYQRAIEAGDCVADAYCNLGIIETKAGNTAKAFDSFTKALKTDPRHAEAHFNLGNLYLEVNDLRLARVHYEIAGEIDPAFANAFFNLALIQAINQDLSTAMVTLRRYRQLVTEEEARNADALLRDWESR